MIEKITDIKAGDILYDCDCLNHYQLYKLKIVNIGIASLGAEVTISIIEPEYFPEIEFKIGRFSGNPIEAYCYYLKSHDAIDY
jgi:hypothetical protein